MASIEVLFPSKTTLTTVSRRTTDNLPAHVKGIAVTDLQGPCSECTQTEKLRDLKKLAQQYARDLGSCDDTQISYLEFLETEAVTFFFLITVHVTDYHWDRHLYFVIYSPHAQTMTHTPPSDDSLLVQLLVVSVACDSD
jgi:hypothetical protein